MPVFREEVLRARTASIPGVIRVGHPPGVVAATAAAVTLGASLLGRER